MTMTIRPATDDDRGAILDLAMRAWEPVVASVGRMLGPELDRRIRGEDWREHQTAEVAGILRSRGRELGRRG